MNPQHEIIMGYRSVDTEILNSIFKCLVCPGSLYSETLSFYDISVKKKGFSKYLCLKNRKCYF